MKSNTSINSWEKIGSVVRYKKRQSLGLIALLLILGIAYSHRWSNGHTFWDHFWEWIDPVAGIGAFIITLVILYNQARELWEDSLEKRLTVHYIYNRNEIATVENAYLAGESDIRQWAQSLGKQMFGYFSFDMNWDDDKKKNRIIKKDKEGYYMHYEVTIYLPENPFDSSEGQEALEKFLERSKNFEHSKVDGDNLPVKWVRKVSIRKKEPQ